MNEPKQNSDKMLHLSPIGKVRRMEGSVLVEIYEPFRAGLKQLNYFSHVLMFWWAEEHDNEESRSILQTDPPYALDKRTGVFACRSEYRPNPIAMTICTIRDVDEVRGIVHVGDIDAYDGTPIVDLKAYFPVCDRVKNPTIPKWLTGWPEWMPTNGIGLEY